MNAKISKAILSLIENGATIKEAMDAILGQGTYDAVVTETYNALRS